MKASKKFMAIVTVTVLAIALLCVNGCSKDEESAQSGAAVTASAER